MHSIAPASVCCCPRVPHAAPRVPLAVPLRQRQRASRLQQRSCCCSLSALSEASWAPLIQPADSWGLLAVVSLSAAGGAAAGKHTVLGRALSGPVCAMLLAWAAFLAGVTPGPGSHFSSMQLSFVQLATPLLLLGADLRGAFLRTRRLGTAFLLGSAATVAGALAAYALLSPLLTPLGAAGDSWKLAAALAAKNIGGGLNYVAVASVTGLSPAGLSAGLVIDNIAGLLYFPLCSFLGRNSRVDEAATEAEALIAAPSVEHTLAALALSCSIVAVSRSLAPSNALPLATAIAVAVATAAPQALRPVAAAGDALGTALLYLFFATAGASAGDPGRAAVWAPFFAFVAILYGVHLSVLFLASRALGFSTPETLLASNANIGGPATAAALADAQGWARLRTPAVLVGTLGNVVATFIALALGYGLLRKL